MSRFLARMFLAALVLAAPCLATAAWAQEARPPLPQRRIPLRRPLPQRPTVGAIVTAPTATEMKPPEYRMEVTGSKRVSGVYQSEVSTSRSPARRWQAYFPVAVEMERQGAVQSSMEPKAEVLDERSRAHRPFLRAELSVEPADGPQLVRLTVRYEATLLARRLVPVPPGQEVKPAPPLGSMERFASLAITPTLDYRSDAFQAWLDAQQLRRAKEESTVDFARRVFLAMVARFAYRDGVNPGPISGLCSQPVLDCDTLSLVFVGAMRASGVPAHVVYGWPLQSLRHAPGSPLSGHAQAEFFAEGVGWVPLDLVRGILHRSDAPLRFFGQDPGELLVVQVDPDYLVTHGDGAIERIISIHPGPSVWSQGRNAKADAAIRPVSWDVVVSPGT